MESPFRGDEAALEARVRALDTRIAQLEARFTNEFWELAAPGMKLALPKRSSAPEPASLEAVVDREQRVAALERALQELPAVEERWGRASKTVDPSRAVSPHGSGAHLLYVPETLVGQPREMDVIGAAGCELVRHLRARVPGFALGGRPGSCWGGTTEIDGAPIDVHVVGGAWVLSTTMAPAIGLVRFDPEGILQDLLEMLRLRREVELGDPAFDGVFVVRGHEPSARALLTPAVRRAVLQLAREASVSFIAAHGRAAMRLSYAVTPAALDAGLAALAAIHATPAPRALRGPDA